MASERETVADILREMRENEMPFATTVVMAKLEDPRRDVEACLAAALCQLADRIEAAWKREKAAIEADALAVGGMVEASRKPTAEKSSAVGDSARMRKALEDIRNMARAWLGVDNIPPARTMGTVLAVANDALSAPPRNCDVYTTTDEARWAYHMHGYGLMTFRTFCDWFLAPVNGETSDGSK